STYDCEKMGIPGIGQYTALSVTDKWSMREKCREAGIATPKYRRAETLDEAVAAAEEIGLPVIIKPSDSQASRGVAKMSKATKLPKWFEKAKSHSRTGSVLIEEMMVGTESSVEAFVSNGEINVLGICDK